MRAVADTTLLLAIQEATAGTRTLPEHVTPTITADQKTKMLTGRLRSHPFFFASTE
jgi:hypothetical protein